MSGKTTACDGLENRLGSCLPWARDGQAPHRGDAEPAFGPDWYLLDLPAHKNPIRNNANEQTGQKHDVVSGHGAAVSGTTGCPGESSAGAVFGGKRWNCCGRALERSIPPSCTRASCQQPGRAPSTDIPRPAMPKAAVPQSRAAAQLPAFACQTRPGEAIAVLALPSVNSPSSCRSKAAAMGSRQQAQGDKRLWVTRT